MKQVRIPDAVQADGEVQYGALSEACGEKLPLEILKSAAGYYLGTYSERGPWTRESVQYWRTEAKAKEAWDKGNWTQRTHV